MPMPPSSQTKKANAERNASIRLDYGAGMTQEALALKYGMSRGHIQTIVSGYSGRQRRDPAEVLALFDEGMSRKQVAERLGMSYNNLSMFIKRHGLTVPLSPRGFERASTTDPETISIYTPLTCEYPWMTPQNSGRKSTAPGGYGSIDRAGYRVVCWKGKAISEHRAVWIYHNGSIPDGMEVHHVDSNRLNNNLDNLALLSRTAHKRLHTTAL